MRLNVGIIGCGAIAEYRHAPGFANNPFCHIKAFYDLKPQRAMALSSTYGGQFITDINALMQTKDIDAVSICVSNEYHVPISLLALESGKHVLCEKPMATDLAEAQKIIETAQKVDRVFMVSHNQRFEPAHIKAREIITSGMLGKVLTFSTTFGHKGPEYWGMDKNSSSWFFDPERSPSGVVGDLGVHKLDLIRYLLDDDISIISSQAATLDKKDPRGNPVEVFDNAVCTLRMSRGAIGTAMFSWTCYGQMENATTLFCEKGDLRIHHGSNHDLTVTMKNGDRTCFNFADRDSNTSVIDHFVDCVVNKKKPAITAMDGYKSIQAVNMLMQSLETDREYQFLE